MRDGRRLVSSLRAAARAKPVILMKVGRHPAGSRAAVSHTGAIVGTDDVFDAVVRRTGAVRVTSLSELVAAAQALASHVSPHGERLAVITNGGGPGVMAADRAADLGLPLATLAAATVGAAGAGAARRTGRTAIRSTSSATPTPARYRAAVGACLADPGVDGIVAILTPQAMTQPADVAQVGARAGARCDKPVIACWMGEASVASRGTQLRRRRPSVFREPELAVEAFAHLASFYRNQRMLLQAPGPLAPHGDARRVRGARAHRARARLGAQRPERHGIEGAARGVPHPGRALRGRGLASSKRSTRRRCCGSRSR